MPAPAHLLDHPPLKVSHSFGHLSYPDQNEVLDLMTLLWHTEAFEASLDNRFGSRKGICDQLPPGIAIQPCSVCYCKGLTGHVAMVKNGRGRDTPIAEELFLTYFKNTLAVGLHSLFLEP